MNQSGVYRDRFYLSDKAYRTLMRSQARLNAELKGFPEFVLKDAVRWAIIGAIIWGTLAVVLLGGVLLAYIVPLRPLEPGSLLWLLSFFIATVATIQAYVFFHWWRRLHTRLLMLREEWRRAQELVNEIEEIANRVVISDNPQNPA